MSEPMSDQRRAGAEAFRRGEPFAPFRHAEWRGGWTTAAHDMAAIAASLGGFDMLVANHLTACSVTAAKAGPPMIPSDARQMVFSFPPGV